MLRKIIFYIIFLNVFGAYSQKILVLDSISGESISEANIFKLDNSKIGVSSDKKAYFSIDNFKKGDTLVLSHINYYDKIFILDNQDTIRLLRKMEKINEVLVSYKKEKISLIRNPWIIDYLLLDSNVILSLQVSNKGNTLNLFKNSKLLSVKLLNESYSSLLADCTGNYYLLGDNYSKMLGIEHDSIVFMTQIPSSILKENIKNCELRIGSKQFFKRYTNSNKNISVFLYNWENNELGTIYNSFDTEFFNYMLDIEKDINSQSHKMENDHPMSGLSENYKQDSDAMFLNLLSKYKPHISIFKADSEVFIIDQIKNIMAFLNVEKGNIYRVIKLKQSFKSTDIKYIIQDTVDDGIYYFVKQNNRINIYILDDTTGQFTKLLTMNRYIEKPVVRSKMLYYLQYDIHSEKRELYRLSLE